jgi:hypothetical protein
MQKRFPFGLAMVIVLGFYVHLSLAAGAFTNASTTSLGSNPVQSYGGIVPGSGNTTVFTADSSSDFVIKDIILTKNGSSTGDCSGTLSLVTGSGDTIGTFIVSSSVDGNSGWGASTISHQFASGLSVLAGESLLIEGSYSCGQIAYTIAGVHSHP